MSSEVPNHLDIRERGRTADGQAIFDLMRRPLYEFVMDSAVPTLGTLALVACLARLRWRALA